MGRISILVAALTAAVAQAMTAPKNLDINDPTSIRNVAATLAHQAMSNYTGNVTNTPTTLGNWPAPIYWWEAGGAWGSMLNYYYYTGDSTYNDVTTQAMLGQLGPNYDLMLPWQEFDTGNDDLVIWTMTLLEAAERNFPQPNKTAPAWVDIAANVWNGLASRWNTSACDGGVTWQIFGSNPNGLTYKNSISNGGFFHMSARLARLTGNSTYLDWANKIYDWSVSVGFVDAEYNVYDGADSKENCSQLNELSFSYSQGIYLYGAAVLYNYTKGDTTWKTRAMGFLTATNATMNSYFTPYSNATNIMYEHACETVNTCDTDMLCFKAFLSRYMWATTLVMPETYEYVASLLRPSAIAAANACTGGADGMTCGARCYSGLVDSATPRTHHLIDNDIVKSHIGTDHPGGTDHNTQKSEPNTVGPGSASNVVYQFANQPNSGNLADSGSKPICEVVKSVQCNIR